MHYSMKAQLHNRANILKQEMKADQGRGNIDAAQKNLTNTESQENIADQKLSQTINSQQKIINKASKEKSDMDNTMIVSNDPTILMRQKQIVSSEIAKLQSTDDAAENTKQIHQLQQQLEKIQTTLQQIQESQPSRSNDQDNTISTTTQSIASNIGPAYTVQLEQ